MTGEVKENLPGKLIAVEGLDGSGKSTQIHLVHRWLQSMGYRAFFSEWNSSILVGEATRKGKKRQLLTPNIKDVGTALLDRLDGEQAGLAHSLESGSLAGDSPVLPKTPVFSSMLADIKALKVKPKKGRVKDLGRIDALLESLHGRIPPGA